VNPSYSFLKIPLKLLSYSTAYITKSLPIVFSLWEFELTPEESATVEAGFEVSLLDKKFFNTITFYREEQIHLDSIRSDHMLQIMSI
jgi:vitamin B12 transporter